ncbi:Hypothetical predicted protein [Olea europaea subsp. europaea]|uniref:Uncharacterized protein n=1 Tax=Olea europaea subsp. europaea TaxID=158383 RepID=A0A8S0TQP8_OLEEU|nr:Hypothetical predicted protein [Olea europaea subsp. europaea]
MGDIPVTRVEMDQRLDDLTAWIEELHQLFLPVGTPNVRGSMSDSRRTSEYNYCPEREQVNLVEPKAIDEEEDTEVKDEYVGVEFVVEKCVKRLTLVLLNPFIT